MEIISFTWTITALLAGQKTVARRYWDENYAARFKVGEQVHAYDKHPGNGGKCVAHIKIRSIQGNYLLDTQTGGGAK